jgi:hypothetical protein
MTAGSIHQENEFISLDLSTGVLEVTFKNGARIDLGAAQQMLQTRMAMIGQDSYPSILKNISRVTITKEARDFLSSDEGRRGVSALALIVDNVVGTTLANFFLKVTVQKPKVPTRIFRDEKKALEWLQHFK